MPFPSNWSMGTFTGHYGTWSNGSPPPAGSQVVITPDVEQITDVTDGTVVVRTSRYITLDAGGNFSAQFPASDDPQTNPTNFTYTVTEIFEGGQSKSFFLPSGGTVDVSTVEPVNPSAGTITLDADQLGKIVEITPASTIWFVSHDFAFEPNVTCITSAGDEFIPHSISHNLAQGIITITLFAASAGKVILS